MKRLLKFFTALLLVLPLAACVTAKVDPTDTRRSVLFGYIDMKGGPTSVDWVFIQHYDGTTDGYSVGAKDGVYYHVGILPGPYQVTSFGGKGFFAGEVAYNFADSGRNDTALIVEQPNAYFAGSFKYKKVKTGLFKQREFDIEKTDTPSEVEILQKVLIRMRKEAPNYTHAIALVEQRLATLR